MDLLLQNIKDDSFENKFQAYIFYDLKKYENVKNQIEKTTTCLKKDLHIKNDREKTIFSIYVKNDILYVFVDDYFGLLNNNNDVVLFMQFLKKNFTFEKICILSTNHSIKTFFSRYSYNFRFTFVFTYI